MLLSPETKPELEKLRSRWRRWLGAKTRWNQHEWINLLDSNWICWPTKIVDVPTVDILTTNRDQIKKLYLDAINKATMNDLHKLDGIFCEDQWKRRHT